MHYVDSEEFVLLENCQLLDDSLARQLLSMRVPSAVFVLVSHHVSQSLDDILILSSVHFVAESAKEEG